METLTEMIQIREITHIILAKCLPDLPTHSFHQFLEVCIIRPHTFYSLYDWKNASKDWKQTIRGISWITNIMDVSHAAHTAITQNYYAMNTTDGGVEKKSKGALSDFFRIVEVF